MNIIVTDNRAVPIKAASGIKSSAITGLKTYIVYLIIFNHIIRSLPGYSLMRRIVNFIMRYGNTTA